MSISTEVDTALGKNQVNAKGGRVQESANYMLVLKAEMLYGATVADVDAKSLTLSRLDASYAESLSLQPHCPRILG